MGVVLAQQRQQAQWRQRRQRGGAAMTDVKLIFLWCRS
jgi:hypothetical protein